MTFVKQCHAGEFCIRIGVLTPWLSRRQILRIGAVIPRCRSRVRDIGQGVLSEIALR